MTEAKFTFHTHTPPPRLIPNFHLCRIWRAGDIMWWCSIIVCDVPAWSCVRTVSAWFSTNSIVFCTEWFYSTAHCLQEKPHQSHGTAGEIWGINPSYNRGRKVFQLLTKHFLLCLPLPLIHLLSSSLVLFIWRSPKEVQRSKTAVALFHSLASHQYMWLPSWATWTLSSFCCRTEPLQMSLTLWVWLGSE